MATYMEKDVLLEYAHIGHLLPDNETEEMKKDSKNIVEIWNYIIDTDPENINYEEAHKKIKEIRAKYEK